MIKVKKNYGKTGNVQWALLLVNLPSMKNFHLLSKKVNFVLLLDPAKYLQEQPSKPQDITGLTQYLNVT